MIEKYLKLHACLVWFSTEMNALTAKQQPYLRVPSLPFEFDGTTFRRLVN